MSTACANDLLGRVIQQEGTIHSEGDIELELKALEPTEYLAAGPHRYPYPSLTPAGFELLLYSLCRSGAVKLLPFDNVTMSLPGGDGGRDLRLSLSGRPVGVIQCKKVDRRLPAPAALREIVKFLLNAELDPCRLPDPETFTFMLALSRDPAETTLSFFESPKTWLSGREDQIRGYVHQLATTSAGMKSIDPAEAAPRLFARMTVINYELLGPADLDELLDSAAASQTRLRFFRHTPVIDLEGARELVAQGFADSGLAAPLEPLTRQERVSLARRVSRRVADVLNHTNLYKRRRTIERAAFMAKIGEFLGNDRRIFPVIGLSGVGKTSAMAWLAERGRKGLPPRLLVRGAGIHNGHLGIRDLLEALPWAEAGYRGGSRFAVEEMFAAEPPLILLDGLNETTADAEHIRNSWIPNTLDWLTRRGAKLVVTCRPEHWAGWQDAFPHKILHLLPLDRISVTRPSGNGDLARDAARKSNPAPENARSIETGDPIRVFQLSDFTESEAIQAVATYGLQDRLSVAQARHPFLLEVAELVDLTRDQQEFSIEAVLQKFIECRIARALGRRERTALLDEASALLSTLAHEMYAARAQVLPADTALRLAHAIPGVIDCLVEEHLLVRDREGFRFQQDQVREHLQAQIVTAEDILREVRPPAIERSKRWIDRLRLASTHAFPRGLSRSELERRRSAARTLQPSVAARAVVGMMREPGGLDRSSVVLDTLFDATDPGRTDQTAEWAVQTILIILSICPPSVLDHDIFAAWLKRLLRRPNRPWLKTWQEQIQEGIISLLTRSDDRVPLKLELLTDSIRRDRGFGWESSNLAGGASTEVAMGSSRPTYRHYDHLLSITASGSLLEHLAAIDPQALVTLLIEWLLDSGEPDAGATSDGKLTLPRAAAISLYHFRGVAIDRVVGIAIDEKTSAASDLLDALAISNPDDVVKEALLRVGSASNREGLRLRRAIWLAFHYTKANYRQIMEFAYDEMLNSSGEARVWALRIFFVEYEYSHRCLKRSPDDEPTARLVETLEQIGNRYSGLLKEHLAHSPEELQLKDDFSYLLQSNFEAGIELLEGMCASDTGLTATAVAGIRHHLKPARLDEEGCRERYLQLTAILGRYLDQHGTVAINRIANFVIRTAEHAGMNRYEFDEKTMIELGFLDLAKRVLAHGGSYVGMLCGSMNWPIGDRPRTELLTAVAQSPVSDGWFEELIFSLFCGKTLSEDYLELLHSLRTSERRTAWDEGAFRHLRTGIYGRRKDLDILRYWQSLPPEELTETSGKIVAWVNGGYSIVNAVTAVKHTKPMMIRSILGTPRRVRTPEKGEKA